MKAALYLWKRRLRWIVLVSVILAVAMGVYAYLYLPVRYEAVAEILMLKSDTESLNALADETIRWSKYDAAKTGTLTQTEWEQTRSSVRRYGNTNILLVKATAEDAALAAGAANALAGSLIGIINKAAEETALKSVVEAGVPDRPIFLYRERLIAGMLVGSFVLLALIVLLFCIRKPKLSRAVDVAETTDLPVLAEIPDLQGVVSAFVRYDPEVSPILYDFAGFYTHEQLRMLSLAIRRRAKTDNLKSLAVVSQTDEEYRSETLVMLAQEMCRQGSRVLLVDMNWYAPRLGQLLRTAGEHDLIHCLAANIPVEQAIVQTDMHNLFFLDQNHTQSMAAQLSASASFSAFLEAMYSKFDFILFDTPEADLFSDALAISGALHACLPVMQAKRWTPKAIQKWLAPMQKLERRVLGIAITGVASKRVRAVRKMDRATRV